MKARLETLRAAWQARSRNERLVLRALAAALAAIALLALLAAIDDERSRLQKSVPAAAARLQRMQDDVAEVARLRAVPAAATAPTALGDALTASLQSHHLDLSVANAAPDRVQLRGSAGFDETIAWLADAQHDFKLHVATLDVSRGDGGPRFDILLVAATP